MTQLADDCFAFGGALMAVDEALAILNERTTRLVETEACPLAGAAGRVLCADVHAPHDVPREDNAAVDGYAFRAADHATADGRFERVGRAAAGHPWPGRLGPGECVRIFTGARMPDGADTVVMQEDTRLEGDRVLVPAGLKPGANRRLAGEDMRAGTRALTAGTLLLAPHVAQAASFGLDRLTVGRPLRIALLSSGDEIREPGVPPEPGAVYDANRYLLLSLLRDLPVAVTDLGIQPDDPAVLEARLAEAAADHHLVLSSGGMSTGEEDHLKAVVGRLGRLHFWRLAIKPGRPLALGQIGRTPFLGLPGNPVAVAVCFLRFARPLILRLAGGEATPPATVRVAAGFRHAKKAGRREWLRATLEHDTDGRSLARRFERQGSGVISSLVQTDGLVELPESVERVEPGDLVEFLPYAGLI